MFIIFDLDGTLAQRGKGTPEDLTKLLLQIKEKGAKIAISSGKPTFYLCGFARQMGLSDAILIGENGAVIQEGVDLPPLFFQKANIPQKTEDALITLRKKLEKEFPNRIWYQPNETELTPFPYYKEDFPKIRRIIDSFVTEDMDLSVYEHPDCFDIQYKYLSKGEGIRRLSELTKISTKDMVAVGDWTNDYPMFEEVGYSIGIDLPDPEKATVNVKTLEEALSHIVDKLN